MGCEGGSGTHGPQSGGVSQGTQDPGFRKNPEKMKVPETSGFLATFLFTRNDFQVKSVFQSLPAWRPRVAASRHPGIGGGRLALRGHGQGGLRRAGGLTLRVTEAQAPRTASPASERKVALSCRRGGCPQQRVGDRVTSRCPQWLSPGPPARRLPESRVKTDGRARQ